MRSWSRGVVAGALAVPVAVLSSACTSWADGHAASPAVREVRIGLLTPLSGPRADAGRRALRGAQYAAALINTANPQVSLPFAESVGLPGLGGAKVTVVPADAASGGDDGVTPAVRLASSGHVAAILGAADTDTTLAASGRTERLGVPFVSADTSANYLTGLGLDWFFRTSPTDRMLGEAAFSVIRQLQSRGVPMRRLAVLAPADRGGGDEAAALTELARDSGYAVAPTVTFRPGAQSLRTPVRRVRATGADVVLAVASAGAQARGILAALRLEPGSSGGDGPGVIGVGAGFADPALDTRRATGSAGVFRVVSWSRELALRSRTAQAVMTGYEQRYHTEMSQESAQTFTALLTVAQGIDHAGSAAPEEVRAGLIGLEIPGGKLLMPWDGVRFDVSRQNAAAGGVVEQLIGARFRVVSPGGLALREPVWPPGRA